MTIHDPHIAINPEDMSGKKLLQSFLAGNPDAFAEIYRTYANDLLSYGIGLGFDRETLKDAIQDVFCKLYQSKPHLAEVQNLKYYLLRMTKNRLLDIYKSQVKFNDITPYEPTFSITTTILEELISQEEQNALQNKVNELLNILTDRQREAIYLRFIQEMEYEEIGKLLEMTPQATRKLVFRAIKRIREKEVPVILFVAIISCI